MLLPFTFFLCGLCGFIDGLGGGILKEGFGPGVAADDQADAILDGFDDDGLRAAVYGFVT